MRALARISILTLVLLAPSVAQAADDHPPPAIMTIPPGDDVIETLGKGEKAPFSGQLFDTNTAMRWGFWLQQYEQRLDIDVKAVRDKCDVRISFREAVLSAERERNKKIEGDLRVRLTRSETARMQSEEDARNPSFFRSLEFGVILGVLGSVGTAVAVAVASK